jgi:hypothetical protein
LDQSLGNGAPKRTPVESSITDIDKDERGRFWASPGASNAETRNFQPRFGRMFAFLWRIMITLMIHADVKAVGYEELRAVPIPTGTDRNFMVFLSP